MNDTLNTWFTEVYCKFTAECKKKNFENRSVLDKVYIHTDTDCKQTIHKTNLTNYAQAAGSLSGTFVVNNLPNGSKNHFTHNTSDQT